ncbi:MAG TPA: hypothetical protein VK177_16975 [Flavobacteriales bacterium]|nr:hypothetical protein [Flavobacteriales bacterium]
MLKPSFTILLFVLCFCGKSQVIPSYEGYDSSMHVYIRPYFYTGTHKPFIQFPINADSVHFYMFDRWGEIIARSKNKDAIIEDALLINGKKLKEDTYIVKYLVFKEGEKKELLIHTLYFGAYCPG